MKGEAITRLDQSVPGKQKVLAPFSLYLSSSTETDSSETEISEKTSHVNVM